ncbi:MAG: phytoene/squalene synthase family protein [Gemmatimonadota bacterium]
MNPPDARAARGYAICERATRRAAANFALGIRLLPPARRRALSAVYWFSRAADDIADAAEASDWRRARLEALRARLDGALAGRPANACWAALADATVRYAVPPHYYHELLDGMARDLAPTRYANWPALRHYCYGVAGVIGLISLRVFGGPEAGSRRSAAEAAAEALGYGLQLTNILRDLREDAVRGRWYLPLDECERFGVTAAAVAAGRPGPGFEALIAAQVERARACYAAGPVLARHLPRATRACPAALAGVYRGILESVAAAPRAALVERVRLPPAEKLVRGLAAAGRAVWASEAP